MALTLRQQVAIYASLLAYQYKTGTKNKDAISIYIKQVFGDLLPQQLLNAFDIETAVGPQLDILGAYIGLPRNIGEPVPQPYYEFSDYDGTISANGFTDYTDPAVNAQAIWYEYQFSGTRNTDLPDGAYRFMLKLKIALNTSDGTLASIQDILHTYLNGTVLVEDNEDMTLTYTMSAATPVPASVLEAYLPKPMGVGVEFVTVEGVIPSTTSKTIHTSSSSAVDCDSDPITVVPSGGVGPYIYWWELVDGDVDGPFTRSSPDTNPMAFYIFAIKPVTKVATWRCRITDSRGIVGYSNEIEVTLSIQPPP